MKLARSSSSVLSIYSRCGLRNVLGDSFYSTAATLSSTRKTGDTLYRRLSPVGDFRVSIVPVLDQWIQEGRTVEKEQLQTIIKEMRHYKRFKHALEISMWMSDKRYFALSTRDIAFQLDLISRVHGMEQAENYFNNIPGNLRLLEVYGALLNCYAHDKSVEKAEAIMQKMRDLGFARTPFCYNVLLNLYYQTGNREKMDSLMHEMEEKDIYYDNFTIRIKLGAYAAASDFEAMDKTLVRMETDPRCVLDWATYSVAANAYTRAGLVDKALAMLKKSEGLIRSTEKRNIAYEFLLTQYAVTGKKDEVMRVWELYKKNEKIYNQGYKSMITSILKFDDIEGAEKIFDEWESRKLTYDRIPTYLIGAYSRKGLLDKAEALIKRIILKGEKPNAYAWYYMAKGYLQDNQTLKAVEAMKEAILVSQPWWKLNKDTLVACLESLKREGELEEAQEFIRLLRDKDIYSADVLDKLLNFIKDVESTQISLIKSEGDALLGDEETNRNFGAKTGWQHLEGKLN